MKKKKKNEKELIKKSLTLKNNINKESKELIVNKKDENFNFPNLSPFNFKNNIFYFLWNDKKLWDKKKWIF